VIAQGALINLVTRTLAVSLGLVITLVAARMGTQVQGAFALFTAVEGVLLALFSGFGIALARRISHHREDPAGLISAIVFACIGMGAVAALGIYALSNASDSYSSLWILACGAPLLLIASNLSGVYLGQGRMMPMAVITLGAPLLTLVLISLYWLGASVITLATILWSWVVARSVMGLLSFLMLRKSSGVAAPDGKELRQMLPFVAMIGLTNLIGLMNYKVDLFLVEHFLGLSTTGVYSIAVMIAELLWFVSSSVTQAAYARIGTPDKLESSRLVVRVMHFSLIVLTLICPFLWLAAAYVLPFLLGQDYAAALPVLAVLLPGVVAYGAASALSAYFTNHTGRPMISAALAGFSLAINVVVSIMLIPRWGAMGAAVATSVSYLLSVVMSVLLFSRMSGVALDDLLRPDWRALHRDIRRLWSPGMVMETRQ
jgi:O-antigen/teichoic acid export membrane protein